MLLIMLIFLVLTAKTQTKDIYTVAGQDGIGYWDPIYTGPATSVALDFPQGISLDGAGNLYIADYDENVVRKVTASTGIITTVAGVGTYGYMGDNGPATSAEFNGVIDVAADVSGNIYIVDQPNNVIRKVTASNGIITTVVGNIFNSGYSGDGGQATSALLNYPTCVAVDDSGNLYIADGANNVIRKVTASGIITTVAGNYAAGIGYSGDNGPATSAQLSYPIGVAVDTARNIYISDNNNVIRKVTASTGIITTVAGNYAAGDGYSGDGGLATSAQFYQPANIAVDDSGNLYIADYENCVIRKVTASTGIITTVAGNYALAGGHSGDGGPATNAGLNTPYGVALDASGNLYIADLSNAVIREVTAGDPLPVTWTSFTGQLYNNNTVQLLWSTATEMNNRGFYVERSIDEGKTWNDLAFVSSRSENGNSTALLSYRYLDTNPFAGTNEYRLKQEDKNGSYAYSTLVSVTLSTTENSVSLYPVPATDMLYIRGAGNSAAIAILDANGKLVQSSIGNSVNIASLAAGIYFVKILNGNGVNETQLLQFIKQ
jgi:hypothetical protein